MLFRIGCRSTVPFLGEYALGKLPDEHRERVESHLRRCSRCAVEAAGVRPTAELLRAYREQSPPHAPSAWSDLRAALLSQNPPAAAEGAGRYIAAPVAAVLLATALVFGLRWLAS